MSPKSVRIGSIVLASTVLVGSARATDVYQNAALNTPVFNNDTILRSVQVQNGMTLQNVNVLLDSSSTYSPGVLLLNGMQTIGGTGTISFAAGSYSSQTSLYTVGGSFSIGSGITVTSGAGGGRIGTYYPSGSFGQLDQSETWSNHGTLSANTAGTALTLGGHWQNDGTLTLSAGTLALNGFYAAADLAHLSRTGGTLSFGGTLDNSNHTFDASAFNGAIEFNQFTLNGGTLINSAGASISTVLYSRLSGVTVASDLSLDSLEADGLTIVSGATLRPKSLSLGTGVVGQTQTLAGGGKVQLNGGTLDSYNANLVIGPQMTVAGNGTIRSYNGLDNQGTIVADGGAITINQDPNPTAGGPPIPWSNHGQLIVRNGGTLGLDGDIAVGSLGTFDASGGTVRVVGTLENTGNILLLNGAANNLSVSGAIVGGTVRNLGGATLRLDGDYTSLRDVTLDTDATLASRKSITLRNASFSLGHALLASDGTVNFDDTTAGEIRLLGPGAGLYGIGTITTIGPGLTIRTSTGGGYLANNTAFTQIINNGTIAGSASGAYLQVGYSGSQTMTNNGTIAVTAGSVGELAPLTNHGTISVGGGALQVQSLNNTDGTLSVTGGRLQLAGTIDLTKLGNYQRRGGTVSINGTYNNTNTTADLAAALGPYVLGNGANIVGGKVVSQTPGQAIAVDSGTVTLNGTTIVDDINVASGAALGLLGNWSNGATITANNSTIIFGGTRSTFDIGSFNTTNTAFRLTGTLNNDGATVPNFAAPGGSITFAGAVNGGTIDGNAMPTYLGSNNGATFSGVTIAGAGTFLGITNSYFNNNATLSSAQLNVMPQSRIYFNGGTLGGVGTVTLNSNTAFSPLYSAGSMTIGSGVLIRSGGSGSATLGVDSESFIPQITSLGTISAETAGQTLYVDGTLTNGGTVRVSNGATLRFDKADPTNLVASTLTGGNWYVGANSSMYLANGSIYTNKATIQFDGPGGTISGYRTGVNQGTLIFSGGAKFTNLPLTNTGLIQIDKTSTLKIGDNIVASPLTNSGTIQLGGGLVIDFVKTSPLATIRPQINTSIISTEPGQTIGFATSSELGVGTFMGVSTDVSAIALRSTFAGDNNLDGTVDITDLGLLASHWQATNADWYQGDYNYDGNVDIVDLGLLASHWQSSVPLATAMAELNFTAVPEPGMAGVLLGAGLLLRRRAGD